MASCFGKTSSILPNPSLCSITDEVDFSSSNEYAQLGGKKTIQPADVIAALKENEFEHFIPRLEAELKSKIACFSTSKEH